MKIPEGNPMLFPIYNRRDVKTVISEKAAVNVA